TIGGVLPELIYRAAVEAFGKHGAAELCYRVGLYCLVSGDDPERLQCPGARRPQDRGLSSQTPASSIALAR
ncbi:MAG TPA: hypothetical protein VL996_06370, partial [Methylocella sp.]|nr:hypothetical protein [Methylocella sp.]